MSARTNKIRQAIERAMARIGCPPGDNADADLYHEMQSALSELDAKPSQTEDLEARIYPCRDCGKMRTKDEGGTTFTVCDECWDKHFKPSLAQPSAPKVEQTAQAEAMEGQPIGEQTPVAWMIPSVFVGINKQVTLDPDVARAVRTNGGIAEPLYRSPLSPEARDRAIEALVDALSVIRLAYGPTRNKINQALSALRGE